MTIKYIAGTKYQLVEDFSIPTPVIGEAIDDRFFMLYPSGLLTIRAGFGWDGASGPTFDTKDCMSASLVHDVFCILMRDRRLSYARWQDIINEFFHTMCLAAGMWPWRAKLWHAGVEFGDAGNPKDGPDRLVQEAP